MAELKSSVEEKAKSARFIRSISMFADLSVDELAQLETIIQIKQFPRNSVILLEEETPHYMYIIYSGRVKVVQSSSDGKEHIAAMHRKGDFFGEMSILDGKTSPATVIALEDCTVGLISKENFDHFLQNNPKFLSGVLDLLCSRLRDAWLKLRVLNFSEAEQRVRAFMEQMGANSGIRDGRGVILTMKLTHQQIASYTNLSRETVTRILNRMKQDGEILVEEGKRIVLVRPQAAARSSL